MLHQQAGTDLLSRELQFCVPLSTSCVGVVITPPIPGFALQPHLTPCSCPRPGTVLYGRVGVRLPQTKVPAWCAGVAAWCSLWAAGAQLCPYFYGNSEPQASWKWRRRAGLAGPRAGSSLGWGLRLAGGGFDCGTSGPGVRAGPPMLVLSRTAFWGFPQPDLLRAVCCCWGAGYSLSSLLPWGSPWMCCELVLLIFWCQPCQELMDGGVFSLVLNYRPYNRQAELELLKELLPLLLVHR